MSTDKQIIKISNKVTSNSIAIYRSSHRRYSVRKGVLRNFAKVTGKYLCQSLYFNKVRPATLLKQRLWRRCFPMNFAKFLRTPFFAKHFWATASKYKEIFYAFDLKNKIFDGIKFQVFTINRTENYYIGIAPFITLKIKMFRQSHFSQFLRVVEFENTPANKNMFKVDDTRATSVNVI